MRKTCISIIMVLLCICSLSCKQKTSSSPKIINGLPGEGMEEFNSVVQIWYKLNKQQNENGEYSYSYCTSSVLSHNTILTAAHCLKKDILEIKAFFFDSDMNVKYSADAITWNIHPNFHLDKDGHLDNTSENDVALILFPDNAFSDVTTPLTIAPNYPKPGTQSWSIGYGCETYKDTEETEQIDFWGQPRKIKINKAKCKENDGTNKGKRYGTNTVTYGGCPTKNMVAVRKTTSQADDEIDDPTGKDVVTTPGDSGGPLLIKDHGSPNEYLIAGVTSGGSKEYGYQNSCYASPIYNESFFKEIVSKDPRYFIPGINIGIGTIELNGKVRVVDVMYNNVYTRNIGVPKTVNYIGSGNDNFTITSTTELKRVWNYFWLHQKASFKWL